MLWRAVLKILGCFTDSLSSTVYITLTLITSTSMRSCFNWKCLQALSKILQEAKQPLLKTTALGIIQGWVLGRRLLMKNMLCGKLCCHSGVLGASLLILCCHFVFRKFWHILLLRTTVPVFSNYILLINFTSSFYFVDHVFLAEFSFPFNSKAHLEFFLLIFLLCHFFASTVFPLFQNSRASPPSPVCSLYFCFAVIAPCVYTLRLQVLDVPCMAFSKS